MATSSDQKSDSEESKSFNPQEFFKLMQLHNEKIISTISQPEITVVPTPERRLKNYSGESTPLEEWIDQAKSAIQRDSDKEAVQFLISHLTGDAKVEIKLRNPKTPKEIFN
ncbi:unnamed protein product, partial [Owenia fusiformis]